MHVFTHTFDYIALGILIACMLLAGAKVLLAHPSHPPITAKTKSDTPKASTMPSTTAIGRGKPSLTM